MLGKNLAKALYEEGGKHIVEALVKEREVKVTRNALEATVNAQADADRYAAEQAANAKLYSRQREAEAEAFEQIKRAEATKQAMLAEADGLRAKGEAEAAAKAAILTAEAEGLEKKAEAMAKMNQAAVLEMYFRALPQGAPAGARAAGPAAAALPPHPCATFASPTGRGAAPANTHPPSTCGAKTETAPPKPPATCPSVS